MPPHVDETVYLPGGQNFAQLAVYCTSGGNNNKDIYIDFHDNMKFHVIDFRYSERLTLDVRDIHGEKINGVSGIIVFEIQHYSNL